MPFLSVFAILMVIFVGYSLSRFLHKADAGLLNSDEVAVLTVLKTLIAMEVLLPIALFFGLILGLGKLHNDAEIVAMHASGISELRLVRPVATLAIPLALVVAFLSVYIRPWAWSTTYGIIAVAEASSDINRIKAGQFYLTREAIAGDEDNEQYSDDRERAIFIEKISAEQILDKVFIRTRTGDEIQVIAAETGLLAAGQGVGYQELVLNNARIFKRVDDGPDLFAQIEHLSIRVEEALPETPKYRSKSVTTPELRSSLDPFDRSEYQWRLSTPLTAILLALLAVPLSRSNPRSGQYAKLLPAFVIYAVYYNLIGVSRTWVEQQSASNIWWAPSRLGLGVVFLYFTWLGRGQRKTLL
jgi:lipopolysaccharide export system permease protein